jgi:hypothetical protein
MSLYDNMTVNGMPHAEYKRLHYKPWHLELTPNRGSIHASWFPGRNRDVVSGSYFAVYPSMPLWENEGFLLSGKQYPSDAFRLVDACHGTGGGLVCYEFA